MMKFIIRSLISLLILLALLLLGFMGFVVYTPIGLQWSLKAINQITDQHFSSSQVRGTWADGFTAKRLSYSETDFKLVIKHVYLKFDLLDLFFKSITLQQLTADSIKIEILPSDSDNSRKNAGFRPPVQIKIANLTVKKINYSQTDFILITKQLSGDLTLSPADNNFFLKSNLNWQNSIFKIDNKTFQVSQASLKLNGNLDHYSGKLNSKFDFLKYPMIKNHLAFTGNLHSINFKNFELKSTLGDTQGTAQIYWEPHIQWKVKIKSQQNKVQHISDISVNGINFALDSVGQYSDKGYSGHIKLIDLSGAIDHKQVSGNIYLNFSPDQFTFVNSFLRIRNAIIKLNGGFKQKWNLTWELHVPNIQHLLSTETGSINSIGKVTGLQQNLQIVSNIVANHLQLYGFNLKQFTANINLTPNNSSFLKIKANNISYQNIKINELAIYGNGNLAANDFNITLNAPNYQLVTQLRGSYENRVWLGKILNFGLHQPEFGTWASESPTQIQIGQNSQTKAFNIELQPICLNNHGQTFCFSLNKRLNYLNLKAQLKNFKLSQLISLINPDLAQHLIANNLINLNFNYQANHKTTAELNGTLSPANIIYIQNNQQKARFFVVGNVNASLKNHKLKANSTIQLSDGQALKTQISIENFGVPGKKQALQGNIHLNYHNLSWLVPIFPSLKSASGKLLGDLKLSGTLAKPVINGSFSLLDGELIFPEYGLNIQDVSVKGTSDHSGKIIVNGNLVSGGGKLNMNGWIDLFKKGMPAELDIIGENVLIFNTDAYRIYATPNLNVIKNADNISFKGTVTVPKANITPSDFSQGSVTLSDDVEFVHNGQKISAYLITGNLEVLTGDDVHLDIKGVSGQVKGSVIINYNSSTVSTASGTLELVNGSFSAYGQNLNIETGKIIYTGGPLDNPGLNVIADKEILAPASTTINTELGQNFSLPTSYTQGTRVKVGVEVQGTAKNYRISLFSNPAIYSQSDILSLILTGETTNNISSNSASLLLKAASSLNLGGNSVSNITNELKESFGLDELGIGQENIYGSDGSPTSTTSLILGKHITPRLFVSYSLGLLDPISILKASYLLTKNWSIQANASTQGSGGDIFYTIEK